MFQRGTRGSYQVMDFEDQMTILHSLRTDRDSWESVINGMYDKSSSAYKRACESIAKCDRVLSLLDGKQLMMFSTEEDK